MKRITVVIVLFAALSFGLAGAATVVPNEIQQPGTQPKEVGNLETPDKCDNCHGGYNSAVEPAFNWRGSMMANAGRDPIFWAALAIAEQDFDGSGDLCLRCHATAGWYGGRSTPTDGSALTSGDADGVECDTCHKMTNPNRQEYLGVMNPPFIANNEQNPATGYYGSGMLSLWGDADKLGPYSDAAARHQFLQSKFHRSVDFCGSCHDVSNPAVGDLAFNNGKQATGDPVTASGLLGSPVSVKAAFNNFPYQYGIVERTYSEFYSGMLSKTLVANYAGLPADLKAGAIKAAFDSAKGNYADGALRYFSCQTCHLRAVSGKGCNKAGVPTRSDLPLHDMTGGNYWVPDAILYQNSQGMLRLGGGLTTVQINALNAGKDRAKQQLNMAASLTVSSNTLRITNLTGHKLISGYPEGRRMWLNIKWYDGSNTLLREDGKYDWLTVSINGTSTQVKTILNPNDPNAKIYEAHYAMTQEWANQLLSLGYSPSLPLSFDRVTGLADYTLGSLAAQSPGTYHETFHFVLNNYVAKDNRIPPYGMSYDEARKRNALPVPANQYGSPGAGGTYNYWDQVALSPPAGAVYAEIKLLYQPTTWEYVQFLYLANNRQNAFLSNEGINMLDTWLNNGMAEPYVMASAAWGAQPGTAPTVTTGAATNITSSSATLNGTVNPNGLSTTAYFQWGTTTSYGSATPSQSMGSGTSVVALTQAISGLTCNTLYHYRAVGNNGGGTTNGSDMTFTTTACPVTLPTVTITANDATATEAGPTTGQFTITRTGSTTSALTVYFTVSGTATSGSDYTSLGTGVSIPAGSASAAVTVTPINDTLVESNETVVATLSANAAYTVGSPSSATVTITSDDVATLPTVTITANDATATEAGPTTGQFTITRTGSTTSALTVYFAASGTATPGSDYTSIGSSVTVPAGSASATVTVTPINDTAVESNETVVATLSANAAYTVGSPNSATVTITSDDVASLPTVTITANDATATEAGPTTGQFTITRSGSTTSALTVYFAVSGTATSGSDYTSIGSSVTIPAGSASATVTVTPINDTAVESNETVVVTLSANAAYTIGSPNSATVTITSDDVASLPTVTITANDATATEAGPTTGQFMITRSGSTTSALTVYFAVSGTATSGSDYTGIGTSVTIPAGSASATVTVTPINDTAVESNETVVVTLSANAAYTVGSPGSATVTITSDDAAGTTSPTVTTNSATSVTSSSATLNGTVNPNGLSTTIYFQWGTTIFYGSTTSSQSIGSGTTALNVSANLTGLTPGTTYHFRIVGSNGAGRAYGLDKTFTTTASGSAPTAATGGLSP